MLERSRLGWLLAIVALSTGSPVAAQPNAREHRGKVIQDVSVAAGQKLAESLCATCHMRGNEAEKSGTSGIPGFRAVANRPGQTQVNIVEWLRSIPPMMPNHHLSRDEMEKLAAFILSLRQ